MAKVMGDFRTALVAAGAHEELGTYEARLATVETRLSVLTWMTGAILAVSVTVLFWPFR